VDFEYCKSIELSLSALDTFYILVLQSYMEYIPVVFSGVCLGWWHSKERGVWCTEDCFQQISFGCTIYSNGVNCTIPRGIFMYQQFLILILPIVICMQVLSRDPWNGILSRFNAWLCFFLVSMLKVMQFSCRLLKERLKLEESSVNWIPTRLKGVRQNQRFFRICPSSSFLVWVQFS
jgi:hypothetical protein